MYRTIPRTISAAVLALAAGVASAEMPVKASKDMRQSASAKLRLLPSSIAGTIRLPDLGQPRRFDLAHLAGAMGERLVLAAPAMIAPPEVRMGPSSAIAIEFRGLRGYRYLVDCTVEQANSLSFLLQSARDPLFAQPATGAYGLPSAGQLRQIAQLGQVVRVPARSGVAAFVTDPLENTGMMRVVASAESSGGWRFKACDLTPIAPSR